MAQFKIHLISKYQFFTVFRVTFGNGYNLRFRLCDYHTDRCGLYSVPKAEGGHTGHQTATCRGSSRAAR
jgi:hypothetical protein